MTLESPDGIASASDSGTSCGSQGAIGDWRAATRRAYCGAKYPRLLCGRCSLYSFLQAPILVRGSKQIPEPARVQAFVSQLPVKTLHVSVLHPPPRFDVHQLDLPPRKSRGESLNRLFHLRRGVLGSIPTAPTNLLHFIVFVFAFDTKSPFDTK